MTLDGKKSDCFDLYMKYAQHHDDIKNELTSYLSDTNHDRSITNYVMGWKEEYNFFKSLFKSCMATPNKAANIVYKENSNIFRGKKVVEIRSGLQTEGSSLHNSI